MPRIAFLVIVVSALAIIGGLDLRFALMSRDLSLETAAAVEQQGLANGIRAVTFAELDQHQRRASSAATNGALLDQHERHAAGTSAAFAALDQHERAGGGLTASSR
jgi:hypothetical protein